MTHACQSSPWNEFILNENVPHYIPMAFIPGTSQYLRDSYFEYFENEVKNVYNTPVGGVKIMVPNNRGSPYLIWYVF